MRGVAVGFMAKTKLRIREDPVVSLINTCDLTVKLNNMIGAPNQNHSPGECIMTTPAGSYITSHPDVSVSFTKVRGEMFIYGKQFHAEILYCNYPVNLNCLNPLILKLCDPDDFMFTEYLIPSEITNLRSWFMPKKNYTNVGSATFIEELAGWRMIYDDDIDSIYSAILSCNKPQCIVPDISTGEYSMKALWFSHAQTAGSNNEVIGQVFRAVFGEYLDVWAILGCVGIMFGEIPPISSPQMRAYPGSTCPSLSSGQFTTIVEHQENYDTIRKLSKCVYDHFVLRWEFPIVDDITILELDSTSGVDLPFTTNLVVDYLRDSLLEIVNIYTIQFVANGYIMLINDAYLLVSSVTLSRTMDDRVTITFGGSEGSITFDFDLIGMTLLSPVISV